MYKISSDTRLIEAVQKAGGLSEQAEYFYYYRNFNLAKTLEDQEKIYIPSRFEIETGLFTENTRLLQYIAENKLQNTNEKENQTSSLKISLNNATASQLDSLPGIGTVTANKIIENRPYSSVEEILDKKNSQSISI